MATSLGEGADELLHQLTNATAAVANATTQRVLTQLQELLPPLAYAELTYQHLVSGFVNDGDLRYMAGYVSFLKDIGVDLEGFRFSTEVAPSGTDGFLVVPVQYSALRALGEGCFVLAPPETLAAQLLPPPPPQTPADEDGGGKGSASARKKAAKKDDKKAAEAAAAAAAEAEAAGPPTVGPVHIPAQLVRILGEDEVVQSSMEDAVPMLGLPAQRAEGYDPLAVLVLHPVGDILRQADAVVPLLHKRFNDKTRQWESDLDSRASAIPGFTANGAAQVLIHSIDLPAQPQDQLEANGARLVSLKPSKEPPVVEEEPEETKGKKKPGSAKGKR